MSLDSFYNRMKAFAGECVRVFKVTKKPNSFEFKTIVKVSTLGIVVIGMIGFILFMIKEYGRHFLK